MKKWRWKRNYAKRVPAFNGGGNVLGRQVECFIHGKISRKKKEKKKKLKRNRKKPHKTTVNQCLEGREKLMQN